MFRQRTWHFSDAGTKFDGRPKPPKHSDLKPISPALKRDIIRCKRCGSRVVSNVSNCPFCGRPLRPVYARFWFWLIVVIVVALGVILFINLSLPEESTGPSSPAEPIPPQVVGGGEDSSLKNLSLGTTIDNDGLEVTVESIEAGPLAANGAQIYIIDIEFINTTEEAGFLYSTQWRLELSDGTRLDTFVGAAADGVTLASNFGDYELLAQGSFSGRLYFAVSQPEPAEGSEELPEEGQTILTPLYVVYQPSALAYGEDLLVTWNVAAG